jgi:hypothetical protein
MPSGDLAEFRLNYEWESADGVATPELAVTWARLEAWAGGDCITLVEDQASHSARRSIYCSLYPLAEWAAYNWWLLVSHVRLAGAVTRPADVVRHRRILRNHHLRAAGDGFLWPNAAIIPEGGSTRIVWARDRDVHPSAPIRFISDGAFSCTPHSVETALRRLIENVLGRLDEAGITDSALEREWRAVNEAEGDPEEAAFCVAAARLGLDPYSLDAATAKTIATIGSKLDSHLLIDFLDAVDPEAMNDGVMWISRTAAVLRKTAGKSSPMMDQLRTAIVSSPNGGRPWERGWEQARRAREAIGLDSDQTLEVDDFVTVVVEPHDDPGLIALGGITDSEGHALVSRQHMNDTARRFATARALWHFAAGENGRFLLTDAHTDRQKIERAFAAELLAPALGVQHFISDNAGVIGYELLEGAADHFGVSPFVIRHQAENQLDLIVADE